MLSGCSLSGSKAAEDSFLDTLYAVTGVRAPYTNEVDVFWDDFHVVEPTSVPYSAVAPYDKGAASVQEEKDGFSSPTLAPVVATKKTIRILTNYSKNWSSFIIPYNHATATWDSLPNVKFYKDLAFPVKLSLTGYSKNISYKLDLSSYYVKDHLEFDSWNKWRLFNQDVRIAVEQNFANNVTHTGILQQFYGMCWLKSTKSIVTRTDLRRVFGIGNDSVATREKFVSSGVLIPDFVKAKAETLKSIEDFSQKLAKSLGDEYDVSILQTDGVDIFASSELLSVEQADLCLVLGNNLSAPIVTGGESSYQYVMNPSVLETANSMADQIASAMNVTRKSESRNALVLVAENVPCIEVDISALDAEDLGKQIKQIVK